MSLPQPDAVAYDGNTVVKSTTYGKSKRGKTSGVDRVKRAIESLNAEAAKLLTLDSIDTTEGARPFDEQVLVNKGIAAALRREALKLTTFVKNNS